MTTLTSSGLWPLKNVASKCTFCFCSLLKLRNCLFGLKSVCFLENILRFIRVFQKTTTFRYVVVCFVLGCFGFDWKAYLQSIYLSCLFEISSLSKTSSFIYVAKKCENLTKKSSVSFKYTLFFICLFYLSQSNEFHKFTTLFINLFSWPKTTNQLVRKSRVISFLFQKFRLLYSSRNFQLGLLSFHFCLNITILTI